MSENERERDTHTLKTKKRIPTVREKQAFVIITFTIIVIMIILLSPAAGAAAGTLRA